MNSGFFRYTEIPPHPFLKGIVNHYRIKSIHLTKPLVFPDYSPVFQGLIFNLDAAQHTVFRKKADKNLNLQVYYSAQAISPGCLLIHSNSFNIIAVNFTATGLYQLMGMDMYHFTDKIIDAKIIFGEEITELYEKLIEAKSSFNAIRLIDHFLCVKAQNKRKDNKACVLNSLSVLNNPAKKLNINELLKITNTSSKTLQRSFKSEIGMSPKMLQRLLRYNHVKLYLQENGPVDWWEVVIRFGFYDHSHLISEFQTFSGYTPAQYIHILANSELARL